jgi:hypothetical protein
VKRLSCLFAALLGACSGGVIQGAQGSAPTPADLEASLQSDVQAVLDPAALRLEISWSDTFADETAYWIQRRDPGAGAADWIPVEVLARVEGTGTRLTWTKLIDDAGEYRVLAAKGAYFVPLSTAPGQAVMSVPSPTAAGSPLELVLDAAEPLSGTVGVALGGDTSGVLSVTFYADLSAIPAVAPADPLSTRWDTSLLPNGAHLLSARVEVGAATFLEVRRQVSLANANVAVQIALSGTSGTVTVTVTATSQAGIQSVETFLDGSSLGALGTPAGDGTFQWTVDTTAFAAGSHTLRAVAVDRSGETTEGTVTAIFDQPPVLTLDSPAAGAIVPAQLAVSGAFGDDTPGAELTISLGDVQVFQTTTSPFSATYDLTGVPPGSYTLTAQVRSADAQHTTTVVQRPVTVGSDAGLTHVADLGQAGALLACDEGQLLTRATDGTVRLRSADGSSTTLQDTASLSIAGGWQLSHGRVAVHGNLGGYPNPYRVFLYEPAGTRRDLSSEASTTGYFDLDPVFHWPWIAWSSQLENSAAGSGGTHALDTYQLVDLSTDTRYAVAMPAEASLLGNFQYDLAAAGGGATLFYWAKTDLSGASDVFSYGTTSQASTRLTSGGLVRTNVQTDGSRIAWQQGPTAQGPFEIVAAPVSDPHQTVSLSAAGVAYALRDGVLAWLESSGGATTLEADDGATIVLSILASARLWGTGGGHVVYSEAGKLYVWDRSAGKRKVFDALPVDARIGGNDLFILVSGGAVYHASL